MKIGVLSDNHGRIPQVDRAVRLLGLHGAEAFIHCGDFGSVDTLEALASKPFWFVWGNTDYVEASWKPLIDSLGGHWPHQVPVLPEIAGARVAVCHGHEQCFSGLCDSSECDYILHGHTHQASDRRIGNTRVINPGALHRTRHRTVALLDTASDELYFIKVE